MYHGTTEIDMCTNECNLISNHLIHFLFFIDMESIILVLYGEHAPNGKLTTKGRNQIETLISDLEHRLEVRGRRAVILTSTRPPALESAGLISETLDVPRVREPQALPFQGDDDECMLLLEAIEGYDVDVIIIVTHSPFLYGFPSFYVGRRFGKQIDRGNAWMGQGCAICCKSGAIEYL